MKLAGDAPRPISCVLPAHDLARSAPRERRESVEFTNPCENQGETRETDVDRRGLMKMSL
jgi:hypothetical protein